MKRSMEARKWLLANGYDDVAALIDEALARLAARGVKTRRNWWDVLAGRIDGSRCIVADVSFPVLKAAQRRQGRQVTPDALERSPHERVPRRWRMPERWPTARRRSPAEE